MPRTQKRKLGKNASSSRTVRSVRAKKVMPTKRKFDGWKWTESYSSFLLGVVVVIVAVLFGVSIVRQHNQTQQTSSLSTGPTPTVIASPTPGTTISENGNTYYIVKSNDSLWDIAQKVYNDGYQWVKIAKANNLTNPSTIFTGDKLLLPGAPAPSELGQMLPQSASSDAITSPMYTVQKDDSLWSIAVRAYADGYQWVKIAKANNLTNPDMIFSGNVLTIPR